MSYVRQKIKAKTKKSDVHFYGGLCCCAKSHAEPHPMYLYFIVKSDYVERWTDVQLLLLMLLFKHEMMRQTNKMLHFPKFNSENQM